MWPIWLIWSIESFGRRKIGKFFFGQGSVAVLVQMFEQRLSIWGRWSETAWRLANSPAVAAVRSDEIASCFPLRPIQPAVMILIKPIQDFHFLFPAWRPIWKFTWLPSRWPRPAA